MTTGCSSLALLVLVTVLAFGGCATLPGSDPLQVLVAGIEPLPGEGMELRLNVKLRVQNPNDEPNAYDGTYVRLEVQGRTFATGVVDVTGSVPRIGESVIEVPVTVSMLRVVRNVVAMLQDQAPEQIRYRMSGKLSTTGFGSRRFTAEGEFKLPAGTVRREAAPATSGGAWPGARVPGSSRFAILVAKPPAWWPERSCAC